LVISTGRDPVSSGLALTAFRSQGFGPTTAICEIIDNSIEAKATEIYIDLKWKKKELGQRVERVEEFRFIDNGVGMESQKVEDCLVLGESTRRLGQKGIGRFGVGATFSGISQAKQIDLFSKTKNGSKWNNTKLDLDELEKGNGIPNPVENNPPKEFLDKCEKQGTVVIWKKVDRSQFTKNDIDQLMGEIGRIYRKFLTEKKIEEGELAKNKPIKIFVQNRLVEPYDPLYLTYNPRKEDKEKIKKSHIRVPLKDGSLRGSMHIVISELPEAWWEKAEHPGIDPVNTQERKLTKRNQGVSIVRGGREVHYETIPYFKLKSGASIDEVRTSVVDRFTSIEISFERDSDEIFGIQNNKSRVLLSPYALEEISNHISDVIIERREYFKNHRNEMKDGGGGSVVDPPPPPPYWPDPDYDDDEETKLRKFAEQLYDNKDKQNKAFEELVKGYHAKVSFELDPNGPFVSYTYELKSIIVTYNAKHPFMQKFFSTLEEIAEKRGQPAENALEIEEVKKIKSLFDLLLGGFGLARKRFPNLEEKAEIENTLNTVINSWGDITNQLTKGKTF